MDSDGEQVLPVERAIARVRRIIRTKDPKGSLVILIWAAMAHVVDLLHSVYYIAFRGRTGAGKGTALESCILLAPHGTILSVVSPAFLASALSEGRAIGIPEADKLLAKDPIVAKLLRDGYRRGSSYGLMVPSEDGKGWTEEERSIFGPKAYDFHVSVDQHLLGRTVVLDMERDASVDRAMDAEMKEDHLAPVREWLAASAAEAKKTWTPESVRALWDDQAFRKEVGRMGGTSGRDHIIAATMLLVCRIYGWDYVAEVRRIVRARKTVDEWGEESEVGDAIVALSGDGPRPDYELPTENVLTYVNERRAKAKLHSLTPRALGGILIDIGFREGETYLRAKSGPNRDKRVVLPHEFVTLTLPAQAAQPAQSTLEPPHWRDEDPLSGAGGQDGQGGQEPRGGDGHGQDGPGPEPAQSPITEESDNWTVDPSHRARARLGREGDR